VHKLDTNRDTAVAVLSSGLARRGERECRNVTKDTQVDGVRQLPSHTLTADITAIYIHTTSA
jgi:hypothetical protein